MSKKKKKPVEEIMLALGRMGELIAHFKPCRIRQLREAYWFTDAENTTTRFRYHSKDKENQNLYVQF